MRVIAGSAGGRRLRVPAGSGVRPTADRVREALFSSLGDRVEGAVVADLYAGSGALGIEALSRGARRAVLVERDRSALQALRYNLRVADVEGAAVVVASTVERFCTEPRRALGEGCEPFDLVLVDAPYAAAAGALAALLQTLDAAGVVGPQALAVLERSRHDRDPPDAVPHGFRHLRDRTYGDTVLRYLQAGDRTWT